MRKLILSTAFCLAAMPVAANTFDGTWALDPKDCSGPYPETQVKISGSDISFLESACTLENPTNLRDMPNAKLFDMVCSGEGSTWSERALVGTSLDDLMIYFRGQASIYVRC